MILMTVWDNECKYLHPSENTEASSSNKGMPQNFNTLSEADIMAEFPKEMLTTEVTLNIMKVIEHIEASHVEAAEVM